MTIDKEQVVFFAGKKMTLGEFVEHYQLQNENEKTIQIVVDRLVKKGKLRFIEQDDKSMKAFEQVSKELDLEARIAEMEAEADRAEEYAIQKKREGKLVYEEVEIDFPTKTLAIEFFEFSRDKLRLEAEVNQVDDKFVLTLYNVTEQDLGAIKRRKNFTQAGQVVFQATDKIANTAINATQFAAEKVVVPAAKATMKTTFGLAKSLIKTGAQVGSTLITSTSQSSRSMAKELSRDEDVLKAKKELIDAKDAVMRLFRRGGKSSPDIRIK